MNSVITTSKLRKSYEGMDAVSYTPNEIIRFINDKFNASFSLYVMHKYTHAELEKIAVDGYKQGEFKFVAYVSDALAKVPQSILNPKFSEDWITNYEIGGIFDPTENVVLYSERLGVALAFYDQWVIGDRNSLATVFAKSNDHLIEFAKYVHQKRAERSISQITTLIDTRHGSFERFHDRDRSVTRDDVCMESDLKNQIFRSIDSFFNDDGKFFKENNISYKRGILLYGDPGNGKTTLIKAIISTVDAPIITWQVTENTDSETIQQLFNRITGTKEATILIIEDLDSIPERSRSTFLNCLDGAISDTGLFIIGTTNFPDKIDPAIMNRAGRFDRSYKIPKPSYDLRREYLVKKGIEKFVTEEQLDALVKGTDTFSMSMLNEVYTSVVLNSHYEESIDVDAIFKAIKKNLDEQKTGDFSPKNDGRPMGFNI